MRPRKDRLLVVRREAIEPAKVPVRWPPQQLPLLPFGKEPAGALFEELREHHVVHDHG